MNTFGTLRWFDVRGDGKAELNKEFREADRIVRLDALVDWISDLQCEYDRMIDEGGVFDLKEKKT